MPMGRPREFDKESCLDAAMTEFWRLGYDSTGMRDLARAMGIGRQSLYNAFGDKRDVFIAAIQHYGRCREAECRQILEGSASPLAAIRALLRRASEQGECQGCLVMNSLPRFHGGDDELSSILRKEMSLPERILSKWLELAQKQGELAADADPHQLAQSLSIVMAGITMKVNLAAKGARGHQEIAEDLVDKVLASYTESP